MHDPRDFWKWWKSRRSQIRALTMLAGLIVWTNLALWQAERNYRGVLREMRLTYRQQEATRERRFSCLLSVLETHLTRLDEQSAEALKQQEMIRQMLEPIVKSAVKPAPRPAPSPTREQKSRELQRQFLLLGEEDATVQHMNEMNR